jgi:hypothetical protein
MSIRPFALCIPDENLAKKQEIALLLPRETSFSPFPRLWLY